MPFIGNQPALSYTSFAKQDFTTSATTSYTLDNPVTNENEIALFINFVRQEPTTAYTASGTSLTLTSATSASDDMYCVFLGKAVQTVNPPSGSVGISQLSATGTKDSTTFLRGDNTFAEAGGGKVLQVVQGVKTDTATLSSGFADTGITATITPSSTSSKILIMCQISCSAANSGGSTIEAYLRLLRNTTAISQGDTAGSRTLITTGVGGARGSDDSDNGVIIFLDSPSTTSATTYKVQATDRDTGGGTFYLNRGSNDGDSSNKSRGTSNIVLMEIGA
nr:hypothetical protein [uncultured Mediterranean phage uvMED]